MITINGASGEGGGQIVRTSLALSLITGKPFEIVNIRANRQPGGLRAQHLAAVELAGKVGMAGIEGAELHSQRLIFTPHDIKAGNFTSVIQTAGAASLVLQMVVVPLAFQSKKSTVKISGGTHVPFSPTYEFIRNTWQYLLARIGIRITINLQQAGFYPRGGGLLVCQVYPVTRLSAFNLLERGRLVKIRGYSGVSNLDENIARRMKHEILNQVNHITRDIKISQVEHPSPGMGAWCCIIAEFENIQQTFTALGKKGKRAEIVAQEAVDALTQFLSETGVVDRFTADQLLLPLSLAADTSTFTTTSVSSHLLTNADVIGKFLDCEIDIQGEVNQPGTVTIKPVSGRLNPTYYKEQ